MPERDKATPAVLLLSPGIIKWTDSDFGLPHLVSIGGYLRERTGVRVEILDLGYEGGDHAHLQRTLTEIEPFLLIGVSAYSSFDYLRVLTLARFLKSRYPRVPLVTGGYHASALTGDMVFEGSPFDAVVAGEGELPMARMVERLLGGEDLDRRVWGPETVEDLDSLPPYRWELLDRYWPRAYQLGRKIQIYLSRGCPHHCAFCMERAKGEYRWRAYSPERAVDELRRLDARARLSRWVVNVADPLFGFARSWRREVLEGIVKAGIEPQQFWTLTRSDDLADEDAALLARARFSIGVGLESGSPRVLEIMKKHRDPARHLASIEKLAGLGRRHGLTWSTNIVVGHPGETAESMEQTRSFVGRLFATGEETRGWLSVDPFRLYPGSFVHENMEDYERLYGTRFRQPRWWTAWHRAPVLAELVDPSEALSFEERVRSMYEAYPPLVAEIRERFRGQGREIDRVFERSLDEQVAQLSDPWRDSLLRTAAAAKAGSTGEAGDGTARGGISLRLPSLPFGLRVRDPRARRREAAVRRLIEDGVLRSEALTEALLATAPERFLPEPAVEAMLLDRCDRPELEGGTPGWLGIRDVAMALEAMEPCPGDRVADLTAVHGFVAALLARLVGGDGAVVAVHPGRGAGARRLAKTLRGHPAVTILKCSPTDLRVLEGPFDGVFIGGTLPVLPQGLGRLLRGSGGRAIAFLGPRFRPVDLVCAVRDGDELRQRVVARARVPVLAGPGGWVASPRPPVEVS